MYLPNKPVKRGFKIFMRCDKNGYFYYYRPYLGKHDTFRGINLGESGETSLQTHEIQSFSCFLTGDYIIHLANASNNIPKCMNPVNAAIVEQNSKSILFFTYVPLVRTLYNHGIYSCGAIKKQRRIYTRTAWSKLGKSTNSNRVRDGPVCRRSNVEDDVGSFCNHPL
ncbi:hypothetical protein KUTeg_015024 [Tegillarca granosa]|uniref:PiggyBac transposable element-derived protein domain-containing protein n=1 Tax=Tegillarca granosa TaxID=220873 RepID=A0ABQ9ETJ7_TEGGR|nr:hypothetical protein KUTeg_015024 [Tegillarca granosa]